MVDPLRLQRAYLRIRDDLLAERTADGHWIGELSSSPLSTATAVSALAAMDRAEQQEQFRWLIAGGLEWLASHQNADGGWGDTDKSFSNVATAMLVGAAFHLAGAAERHRAVVDRGAEYVERAGGVAGIRRRYGKDKTFSVPILANAALAGLVEWSEVAPLPFEMACLPQAIWGMLHIPVVSYAIPALVAIGQARFHCRPPRNPILRWLRRTAVPRTLPILQRMQPSSGGYLEATPLTSFVVMSLAASGRAGHPVAQRGLEFLLRSVRGDGSWPIDTNLATWATTMAANALAAAGEDVSPLVSVDWLLACQHRARHPMTGTAAGGWGWSDLSGAVPDADDTSAALLALATLRHSGDPQKKARVEEAAGAGLRWLLALQNADGGWPTFCRGWGAMPFDRSGADLTAHAIRALHAWYSRGADPPVGNALRGVPPNGLRGVPPNGFRGVPPNGLRGVPPNGFRGVPLADVPFEPRDGTPRRAFPAKDGTPQRAFPTGDRVLRAIRRGRAYLQQQQRDDGSWVPLWFGNQCRPDEENPVYGTARVLLAYRDLGQMAAEPARRGLAWLAAQCDAEGGWGGPVDKRTGRASGEASVEETGMAVEALLAAGGPPEAALLRGLDWLVRAIEGERHRQPAPIGLYFAKLWYYEKLYPLIFAVSALGQAVRRWPPGVKPHAPASLRNPIAPA